MPRKIFLSFLGAIPYYPTKYYLEANRQDLSDEIYFVQEHLIRRHRVMDEVIIFTTHEASKNNYHSRIERPRDQPPVFHEEQGLESALQPLKADGSLKVYREQPIANGYSEAEIWDVFQTVFEQLEEGDHVIFDVTFGFRSLPMLVIVLLNYARTLKNITVEAIYYGNYEAGKEEKSIKGTPHVEAPVLRLDAFVQLQDWTHAAQSFAVGNVTPLSRITQAKYPAFSQEIDHFAKAIQTCRGFDMIQHIDVDKLKANIQQMSAQSDIEAVLRPLLDIVGSKLAPFQSRQLSNGFAAVEWCIEHGMIQQGVTILQETLQSYVIESILGRDELTMRIYRFAANGALGGYKSPKRTIEEAHRDKFPVTDDELTATYQSMYELVKSKEGLSVQYRLLTGELRNDINHGGFRDNYMTPAGLKAELSRIFDEIKALNL